MKENLDDYDYWWEQRVDAYKFSEEKLDTASDSDAVIWCPPSHALKSCGPCRDKVKMLTKEVNKLTKR